MRSAPLELARPDLWLNLEKRYDLHQAQQELGEKIKKFRRWKLPESEDLLSRINLICPTGK